MKRGDTLDDTSSQASLHNSGSDEKRSSETTPSKSQGYFSRFLPKFSAFGASPKPDSAKAKAAGISSTQKGTPRAQTDGLIKVIEQNQVHQF